MSQPLCSCDLSPWRPSLYNVQDPTHKLGHILRQIGQQHRLKDLIRLDVSDLWLPVPKKIVQRLLGHRYTESFLNSQSQHMDDDLQLNLTGEHVALLDSDSIGFDEGELLGKGGFGEVYQVFHPWTEIGYARKVITRPTYKYQEHRDVMRCFKHELSAMQRVQHLHCVDLVASCTSPEAVILFSSPVADRNLAQMLNSDLSNLDFEILRTSLGCITSALAYLHRIDIRHEDIKPQNILIHGSSMLLTDFGSCHEFTNGDASTTTGPAEHTTPRYRAPEVLDCEPRNRLTDIWSLGCVLFEILARLQGHKLSALIGTWHETDNREVSFARNSQAVAHWFEKLTGERDNTQHGYNRKYTWLCSFTYYVMLNQTRLRRPSAAQVLRRLQDLDAIYPVDIIVKPCCVVRAASITSRMASSDCIPQWPILDLMLADKNLSHIFLDTNLHILGMSGNISNLHDVMAVATTQFNPSRLVDLLPIRTAMSGIQTMARSMLPTGSTQVFGLGKDGDLLAELLYSTFTASIIDTLFRVDTLNLILDEDMLPRPRTVQLSLLTVCLERLPDYKVPFLVLTFNPTEREVTGLSYREGKELWTDGLSIAAVTFGKIESEKYGIIAKAVEARRARYNKLLNESRIIVKGFKEGQCFRCRLTNETCSGVQAGGCKQCRAVGMSCKFSPEDIAHGGESSRYIDWGWVDQAIQTRWNS